MIGALDEKENLTNLGKLHAHVDMPRSMDLCG